MAFYLSHLDELPLDIDEIVEVFSSAIGVIQHLELEALAAGLNAQCEFKHADKSFAEVRVFSQHISLDGSDDAIFDFVIWFQNAYSYQLVFGMPEAPTEIELRFIRTHDQLKSAMVEAWG